MTGRPVWFSELLPRYKRIVLDEIGTAKEDPID
jgi:hypothetical protein